MEHIRTLASAVCGVACLFMIAASAGCVRRPAYHGQELDDARRRTGTAVVVSSTMSPLRSDMIFGKFHVGGASGAARGAALGVMAAAQCELLFFICAPIGFAVGGVAGAIGDDEIITLPADDARKIVAALEPGVTEIAQQHRFAEQLLASIAALKGHAAVLELGKGTARMGERPAYRPRVSENVDMVIEARITEMGFWGTAVKGPLPVALLSDPNFIDHSEALKESRSERGPITDLDEPRIGFYFLADVTAVSPTDGSLLYEDTFNYSTVLEPVSEWARNVDLLRLELRNAVADISERAMEDLFFGYQLKAPHYEAGVLLAEADYCVLRPYEPVMPMIRHTMDGSYIPRVNIHEAVPLDTLRPKFVWQAFPRDRDLQRDKALSGITSVTYDLRIWRDYGGTTPLLAYEKRGLTPVDAFRDRMVTPIETTDTGSVRELAPVMHRERVAEYTLDVPVQPAALYAWSVRARFVLDGQTRVTPWSRFFGRPGRDTCDNSVSGKRYFVFRTAATATR